MTLIRPPSGGRFCIPGSTPAGGQITPEELASLSLGFWPDCPLMLGALGGVPGEQAVRPFAGGDVEGGDAG
jgi:hypothetical protein